MTFEHFGLTGKKEKLCFSLTPFMQLDKVHLIDLKTEKNENLVFSPSLFAFRAVMTSIIATTPQSTFCFLNLNLFSKVIKNKKSFFVSSRTNSHKLNNLSFFKNILQKT